MEKDNQSSWISQRLEYIPIARSDADEMYAGLQDEALYAFIPDDPPVSANALRKRYAKLESRCSPNGAEAWLNWVLRSRIDRICLGYVQATVKKSEKEALIAYVIFAPFWGQGYAKEAVSTILTRIFSEFGLNHVEAFIDTRNKRSIAVVESLGFTRAEFIPNADHFKGSSSDEYRYRICKPPA